MVWSWSSVVLNFQILHFEVCSEHDWRRDGEVTRSEIIYSPTRQNTTILADWQNLPVQSAYFLESDLSSAETWKEFERSEAANSSGSNFGIPLWEFAAHLFPQFDYFANLKFGSLKCRRSSV